MQRTHTVYTYNNPQSYLPNNYSREYANLTDSVRAANEIGSAFVTTREYDADGHVIAAWTAYETN